MQGHQVAEVKSNAEIKDLHHAAAQGDVAAVKAHMDNYQQIDVQDKKGCTPLHCALLGAKNCEAKDKEAFYKVIKILLKNLADVTLENRANETPLLLAARYNMLDVLKIMFKYNALIGTSKKNQKFLNILTPAQALEFFSLLLDSEVDTKMTLNVALQAASESSRADFFEALIYCFNDENKKVTAGKLLLFLELDKKSEFYESNKLFYEIFIRVCKAKAINTAEKIVLLDAAITDKASGIFEAALNEKFDEEQVQLLKRKILEMLSEAETKMKTSPPEEAKIRALGLSSSVSEKKEEKKLFKIFEKKAEANKLLPFIAKNDFYNVTILASRMSEAQIVADVDSLCTAIRYQSDKDRPDVSIINIFLKYGFSVTKIVDHGKANIHLAAECQSVAVLRAMLENPQVDVNVNQLADDGFSPLHLAAQNDCLVNVVFLLKNHANPFILTPAGKTFLEIYAAKSDINVLLKQSKLKAMLFEKSDSDEESKNTVHAQSITHYLMDKYCEQKSDDNLENILISIATQYPHSFYKQFKRMEEAFSEQAAKTMDLSEKQQALSRQKRICELVLKVTSPDFLDQQVHFHNRFFKSKLTSAVRARIQVIGDNLGKFVGKSKQVLADKLMI